jgi:hypothetical protein
MRPITRVPLSYGVIGGILGAALSIGLYYLGPHPFLLDMYVDYRIFLFSIFIFFALKEVRDFHQGGVLYFSQGLVGSLIFITGFAIAASLIIWVFAVSVPAFVGSYKTLYIQKFRNMPRELIDRIGKDVYLRNLAAIPSTNAFDLAILYFGQCYIIGAFISIILSVIIRRQPKT